MTYNLIGYLFDIVMLMFFINLVKVIQFDLLQFGTERE